MTNNVRTNYFLVIILILCASSIIFSNYIFSKKLVLNIDQKMLENEYNKIWWKENYELLKELQKQEILTYLNKLKEENPELIETLKERMNEENNQNTLNVLDSLTIHNLKQNSFILWNTWSTVSVIEFSDLECEFCIDYNKEWIKNKILEKYNDNINYSFKNFPLPSNKNAESEAIAWLCINKIAGWEKYLEYIDLVFKTTKWGWEWFDLKNLTQTAVKLWVDKTKFEKCYNEKQEQENLTYEINIWTKLWIKSVPSTLILNNKTWEYKIINEKVSYQEIENTVWEFLK